MVITNKNGSSDWLTETRTSIFSMQTYVLQIYVHTSKDKILEVVARLTDAQWAEMNISGQNKISSSGIDRLGWGYV